MPCAHHIHFTRSCTHNFYTSQHNSPLHFLTPISTTSLIAHSTICPHEEAHAPFIDCLCRLQTDLCLLQTSIVDWPTFISFIAWQDMVVVVELPRMSGAVSRELVIFSIFSSLLQVVGADLRAFANQKSFRRTSKDWKEPKSRTLESNKNSSNEYDKLDDESSIGGNSFSDGSGKLINDNLVVKNYTPSPRNDVLQACIFTSGLIFTLGMIIRQISHVLFVEGWAIHDSSSEVTFNFEAWHLELIMGLVILISSCRYLLLKMWPDFAESSEAANQQVLGSLQPLDYVLVAFLPGISEELLFRGALLPIFGLSWKTALAVGAMFGVLHLGNGRKYSFAFWATFVGLSYGLATVMTSSVIVPIASHSLNNLIGGILWRYTSPSWRKNN